MRPILLLSLLGSLAFANQQRQRVGDAPAVGMEAPAVEAATLDGKGQFSLASNRGKRATVLVFGSCT